MSDDIPVQFKRQHYKASPRIPRHTRTPAEEAERILNELQRAYSALFPDLEVALSDLFIKPLAQDASTDGDATACELIEHAANYPSDTTYPYVWMTIFAACSYAVQAIKAEQSGLIPIAWTYVLDAEHWYGKVEAVRRAKKGSAVAAIFKEQLSAAGKKGALERHLPMKKLKAYVIERYGEKSWPSANKAAHDLKHDVITHGRSIGAHLSDENAQRTIADWIREYVKEQSTSSG